MGTLKARHLKQSKVAVGGTEVKTGVLMTITVCLQCGEGQWRWLGLQVSNCLLCTAMSILIVIVEWYSRWACLRFHPVCNLARVNLAVRFLTQNANNKQYQISFKKRDNSIFWWCYDFLHAASYHTFGLPEQSLRLHFIWSMEYHPICYHYWHDFFPM